MSQRSFAYDQPSYVTRQAFALGTSGAGASSTFGRFVAHANLQIYGLTADIIAAGTSTTTFTNAAPPATAASQVMVNGQSVTMYRVFNTAAAGTAPALSTTTVGPFLMAQLFANGTLTGAAGLGVQAAVNSGLIVSAAGTTLPNPGLSNQGGFGVNLGDLVYFITGTDATANSIFTVDYQIQPGAAVTA